MALLLVAPLLGGCGHGRQEALDAVHLEPPDCGPDIRSFAVEEDWWLLAWVEVSLTLPTGCMNDYLRARGADPGAPWLRWPSVVMRSRAKW
ncbi:hypothetical protein ABZZ20_11830 [Streptomyces sp. NPDC006430]|uniref:hypothetical protein n=1 Tax=Streptomyces sp. NPDC006430 TaxID=3154299 RepID=UPI00339DB59F